MDEGLHDRSLTAAEELLENVPGGPHDVEIPHLPFEPPVKLAALVTSLFLLAIFAILITVRSLSLTSGLPLAIRLVTFLALTAHLSRLDRVGIEQVNEELDGPGDPSEDTGEHANGDVVVDDVAEILVEILLGFRIGLLEEVLALVGGVVSSKASHAVLSDGHVDALKDHSTVVTVLAFLLHDKVIKIESGELSLLKEALSHGGHGSKGLSDGIVIVSKHFSKNEL